MFRHARRRCSSWVQPRHCPFAVKAAGAFALVLAPRPAQAQVDVALATGPTAATTKWGTPVFVGASVAFATRWVFADMHAFGVIASLHRTVLAGSAGGSPDAEISGGVPGAASIQDATQIRASYRLFLPSWRASAPFVGVSFGGGIWFTCVRGDYCGGVGPAPAGELGYRYRLSRLLSLDAGAEVAGQMGMHSGAPMIMPTLWLSLAATLPPLPR